MNEQKLTMQAFIFQAAEDKEKLQNQLNDYKSKYDHEKSDNKQK